MSAQAVANLSCVAVGGRGVLITGPPGAGKSSLALALIDRGAILVGDDGVTLEQRAACLWADPPPNIAGRIEIRGVGIADMATTCAPVCLVLALEPSAGPPGDRLPEPGVWRWQALAIPQLQFAIGPDAALRAEWALRLHGLDYRAATNWA